MPSRGCGPGGSWWAGGGVLLLASGWCGPGLAPHWPGLAAALHVPRRMDGATGVFMTFDDGPHPEGTPAVLGALEAAGAPAMFFLVGEQAERFPALAREIVAGGHRVAVHGYRHRNQMRLLPREFATDLERARVTIEDCCGQEVEFYRPPYGVFTLTGLVQVRGARLKPLLWSKWGRDWRGAISPKEITWRATDGAGTGDVILLHDADWYSAMGSHRRTAAAVPEIIDRLRAQGLSLAVPG